MENEEFYRIQDLANKLGIKPRSIQTKIRNGELIGCRVFGRWYVLKSNFLKFLKNNEVKK